MDKRVEPSPEIESDLSPAQGGRRWRWLIAAVIVIALVLVWRLLLRGSGGPPGISGMPPPPGMGSAMGGPPQSVAITAVSKGDVPITLTSLGTVTSLATATVKSQISGYLVALPFHEGDKIKKDTLLAQVDPRPYQVALAQYEGQLQKDQALLDNARIDLKRYVTLHNQDSIARQTVETQEATVREYEGTVKTDQAQVDNQKLNLTYCRVVAPVAGKVGLRQVDVGNYVTPSDSNGIVVVTQTDPISVVFTLPEDDLHTLKKRLATGAHLAVTAYDRTGNDKLAEGMLDTIDNVIDTTTGTVKLRAMFANADDSLFPNQFVNITLHMDALQNVLVVPTTAVQTGTPGTYVYRVNPDNTVSLRKIKTGASSDGRIAVLSGLAEDDKVVVDGADHLSDGAKIRISDASGKPIVGGTPNAGRTPSAGGTPNAGGIPNRTPPAS